MRLALWALMVVVAVSGCGRGGVSPPAGTNPNPLLNLTGTWDALMTVTGGSQRP